MAPVTRAQRRAALVDSISHPDVLVKIFQHLPLGDQCCTVSMVSKHWRQWAAGRQAFVMDQMFWVMTPLGYIAIFRVPLWYVRREWSRLCAAQREHVAQRAAYPLRHHHLGICAEVRLAPGRYCD